MLHGKNIFTSIISAVTTAVLMMLLPVSCDIYDDLPPCPRGLSLDFVYDYNMEFADAFYSQVDCLTVYFYDEEGNLLLVRNEDGAALKDKDYRMNVDLEHGRYHVVAYGGLTCTESSFEPVNEPVKGSRLTDLKVRLKNHSDTQLHDFFYGSGDFVVDGEMYKEGTLHLVKDTNNIRVMLQHVNGERISSDDFEFEILDDNSMLDYDNRTISNGDMIYHPWTTGNSGVQQTAQVRANEFNAAFAEFSTSRLMKTNSNRLVVRKVKDGQTVLSLPLNDVLLLLKSEKYGKMGSQEFLDRESNWSLVFFLKADDTWFDVQIVINGWTVKLNDIGF